MTEMSFDERNRDLVINDLMGWMDLFSQDNDYGYEKINKELHKACTAHRDRHAKELKDVIVALIHHDLVDLDKKKVHPESLIKWYHDNLRELVSIAKKNDWSTVLFTFPEIYCNHKQGLEQGLYDRAYFTEFCKGKPYKEDLSDLEGRVVLAAGCYGNMCVKNLIFNIHLKTRVKAVPQAVLYSYDIYQENKHGSYLSDYGIEMASLNQLKAFK
jgi:phosphoribosyl-ATP pyrophosphohydrolase